MDKTSPSNTQPKSPPKRLLRIVLGCLAGIVALAAVTLIAVVLYLRSSAGSQKVLQLLQDQLLVRMQTRMEFAEGRFDPFSGLHFRDLHVMREVPEGQVDLHIASVDVSYGFQIWARRFELNELRLVRPKFKVKISGPRENLPEETKTEGQSASGLESLASFLIAPPVNVSAKNITIDQLEAELELRKGEEVTNVKIENFGFRSQVEFQAEKLALSGEITPDSRFSVRILGQILGQTKSGLTSPSKDVDFSGAMAGKWAGGIRREAKEWVYEVEPTQFALSFGKVRTALKDGVKATSLNLKSGHANAKLHLVARTVELFKGSHDAVKTDEVSAEVVLGPLALQVDDGKTSTRLEVKEQRLKVISRLAEAVGIEIDFSAGKISLPEKLARPVALQLQSQLTIPRDLASAQYSARLKLESSEFFTSEGVVTHEQKTAATTAKGRLQLNLARELLTLLRPGTLKGDQLQSAQRLLPVNAASEFQVSVASSGALSAQLQLGFPQLRLSGFSKPWGVALSGQFNRDAESLLSMDAKIEAKNEEFGQWRIATKTSLQAASPTTQLMSEGRTEITQLGRGDLKKLPLILHEAVSLEHKIHLQPSANQANVILSAPDVAIDKKARVKATHLELRARSHDLKAMQNVDVELMGREGAVELDPSLGETPLPIQGLELAAKAGLRDGSRLTLENFVLNLNRGTMTVTVDGVTNLKTKDVQLRSEVDVNINKDIEVAGQKLRGQIQLPLTLTVFQGREATLLGGVQFQEFAWSKDKMAVSGFNGRLPFSEKLIWDGKDLRFQNLIKQNPFERVSFERVRPLLQGADQVRIEKIQWEEREYGPFVGALSMNQNMLSVHQFDLDLGPGRVYGEMYFDTYPANLQLGFLARMTSLDLGEILPKRFLTRMRHGTKTISGRSGFVLNINRGVLDGRIDLTELGGEQLVALMNTLDPTYEDEKMNKVRGVLQLGYPTALALAFKDGYMDMDVDLSVLGIGQRQSLRDIPLSSLLGKVTADIVKKTEKGPLKK